MSISGFYQRMFNTVTEATDIYNSVIAINVCGIPDASATIRYSDLNTPSTVSSYLNGDTFITSLGYGSSYVSTNSTVVGSNTVSPGFQQNGFPGMENTFNVGVGFRALQSLMNTASGGVFDSRSNVGVGTNALQRLLGSSGNTAIGSNAMINSQFTHANTAVGNLSLLSLRDPSSSVNVGHNTSIGNLSLLYCASGTSNTTVGNMTLHAAANASGCIALGKGAAQNPFFVSPDTIALGCSALCEQISGVGRNISIGYDSMCALKVGADNVAIGGRSMFSCVSGSRNIMVGAYPINGGYAPFLSTDKIYGITGGDDNIIIGTNSAHAYGSMRNIVIGNNSLSPHGQPLKDPNDNIVIGSNSMKPTTNYNLRRNVIIGNQQYSLLWDQAFTPSNDDNYITVIQNNGNYVNNLNVVTAHNTIMGPYTGICHYFGGGNTLFGAFSWVNRYDYSYTMDFGYSWNGDENTVLGASIIVPGYAGSIFTTIVLGDDYVSTLRCQVNLTVVSDMRDKYIEGPLTVGLDFIEKLRPVTYVWNKRNLNPLFKRELDRSVHTGIIAQEVKKVIDDNKWDFFNIVDTTHEQRYTINPEGFLPPISVSLKELKNELSDLHNRIDKLSLPK